MGQDKAFIEVEGETLAGRARRALLEAGAGRVISVGGDEERLRAHGFDTCTDAYPGEGPLGGLLTALAAADLDPVMVLACDLPHVDAGTVRTVVDRLGSAMIAVPRFGGRLQVLHAAYRRDVLDTLNARFLAGERSITSAIAGLDLVVMDDIAAHSLRDVDVPGQLPRDALGRI